MHDWQTWTALGIVGLSLALLIRRALSRRSGCGGDCGCGRTGTPKRPR